MQIQVEMRVNDAGVQFRAVCGERLENDAICGEQLEFGYRPDIQCSNGHSSWNESDWQILCSLMI